MDSDHRDMNFDCGAEFGATLGRSCLRDSFLGHTRRETFLRWSKFKTSALRFASENLGRQEVQEMPPSRSLVGIRVGEDKTDPPSARRCAGCDRGRRALSR